MAQVSPVASTTENMGMKRKSKHKLPHPSDVVPHNRENPVVPPKRKPGRPLSTSSTARAIVRDLAELHCDHNKNNDRSQVEHSRGAFDHVLPPFPEVSAYVGEEITGNSLDAIAEEDEDDPAFGEDTGRKTIHDTPPQPNKVAAKKHRELIKERTKNVRRIQRLSLTHS